VSQPRRPPLYALSTGARRRRRARLRSTPVLVLSLLAIAVVAAAAGIVIVRVLPLTNRDAGVVRSADVRWGPGITASTGRPPAGLWAGHVSHRPIRGVAARAALIADWRTGRVLWARAPHRRLPVASLTKLMTALVVVARHDGGRFIVSRDMIGAPGAALGLRPGDRVSVRRMLAAMLIASANDAADSLAVQDAGSVERFVARMNRQARRYGMRDTRFSNPSGIFDTGNRSSAWDVGDLARRVLRQRRLSRLVRTQVFATGPTTQYVNLNRLLWTYPGAVGVKTGSTTAAGNCLAAAARRNGRHVLVVLLHVNGDEFKAAEAALDWGFRRARGQPA
jgi:serine-type D-Ala-D-Ala carboxypeptidase (penicillin-binding protein 5/6)